MSYAGHALSPNPDARFGIFWLAPSFFMAEHQTKITAHAITAPASNRGVPDPIWEILKERSAEGES